MGALTEVLTLLIFLVLALPSQAAMGDGGNRVEHAALCAFISMAGRKLEIPELEPLNDEAYKYLQELNFTLAPKEWQSQFYKETDRSTVHANAQDAGLKNRGEDKYWADWAEAATAFKKDATTNRIKSGEVQELGNEGRAIAAAEIAEITDHAAQIRSGYPAVGEQKKLYEPTNPPASVAIAIFGDEASTAGDLKETKLFGAAVGATAREAACSTDGSNPKPVSAVAMLTCICGRDNANPATNFECTKEAKPSGTWTTSSTAHSKADMQKLAKSCGPPPATKITLEEIRTAVARFRSLVHTDATHGYFGHYEQTNCDGNSGNGICVKFTNLATNDKAQIETKTWLNTFISIADGLEKLKAAANKAHSVNMQLKAQNVEAITALKRSKAIAGSVQVPTPQAAQKPKIDVNTQCVTHNKSKNACLKAQCKWGGQKDDDGPCSPSEAQIAEHATQAGAGDAAKEGAAATGCARHGNDKAAYDIDKTDDKQNCAWIKGKDSEDDKEKEKFRSSSFLLNKQLALSMVAEFVSLIASQNLKIIRGLLIFMKIMNIS